MHAEVIVNTVSDKKKIVIGQLRQSSGATPNSLGMVWLNGTLEVRVKQPDDTMITVCFCLTKN
jgi:hypothetical protein